MKSRGIKNSIMEWFSIYL